MPIVNATWSEKSCWESTETNNDNYISKVEVPGDIVFDDNDPYGHCDYAMWVYGKIYGHSTSSVTVKMYVEARYHVAKYFDAGGSSHTYYWDPSPDGMIHFEGDYDYGWQTPGQWTWQVQAQGGGETWGMQLSAAYTGNPDDSYYEANSLSGDYRYLGWVKSQYNSWPSANQKFTALIKCHVDNAIADDYYDGVVTHYSRYVKITYIESIRVKFVFEYRAGWIQWLYGTHTHIVGDGVGPSDLDSIPLVPGSTT
ncbi:MAG: hypothetical protein ACXAAO_08600 [Candidatus Thorarchaeota archaeon]|jgi:hypothetical protein